MANVYRLRDATYPRISFEPTHLWMKQVRHRLIKEFAARTSVADIAACIDRACVDVQPPSPAALPELVERLARVRLSAQVGLTE